MTSHKAENSITDQECDSAEVGERQRSSCARVSRSRVKESSQGAKSRSQVEEPSHLDVSVLSCMLLLKTDGDYESNARIVQQ